MHILGLDLLLYSYILLECKLGFNVNNLLFCHLFSADLRIYNRLNVNHVCVCACVYALSLCL